MIVNRDIVPGAATELFSASGQTAITTMFFHNDSVVNNGRFDVYLVKSGQNPGAENQILNNAVLNITDTFSFSAEKIILEVGDKIFARSTGTTVRSTISAVLLKPAVLIPPTMDFRQIRNSQYLPAASF